MIVVTGAAGFIGSNIVADLEEKEIIVSDWLGNGNKWRNLVKRKNIRGLVSPECLLDYIDTTHNSITAVIHMGAISSTAEADVDKLLEWNTAYSVNLWKCCNRYGIPFIYASSAAIYGASLNFNEDQDSVPLNPYGWSKNLVDQAILTAAEKDKSQFVGLRFFNVYGPNEYHKGSQGSMVFQAYGKGPIGLFNGDPQRDFIYVKDCCRIIRGLLNNPGISGIFNIGTGIARPFDDIAIILGTDMYFFDMPEKMRSQYQNFTKADTKKIEAAGLWFKPTSLEKGIKDYVDNYLSRKDQYR